MLKLGPEFKFAASFSGELSWSGLAFSRSGLFSGLGLSWASCLTSSLEGDDSSFLDF